jgi:hypothetical protein
MRHRCIPGARRSGNRSRSHSRRPARSTVLRRPCTGKPHGNRARSSNLLCSPHNSMASRYNARSPSASDQLVGTSCCYCRPFPLGSRRLHCRRERIDLLQCIQHLNQAAHRRAQSRRTVPSIAHQLHAMLDRCCKIAATSNQHCFRMANQGRADRSQGNHPRRCIPQAQELSRRSQRP